jgi:hypothetical protein
VPLKELELWLKRGQNVSFLREICPRKKCTPNIGANIGAITGILLKSKLLTEMQLKTEAENRVGTLQRKVTTLQGEAMTLQDRAKSFDAEMNSKAEAETRVETLQGEVTTLQVRVKFFDA